MGMLKLLDSSRVFWLYLLIVGPSKMHFEVVVFLEKPFKFVEVFVEIVMVTSIDYSYLGKHNIRSKAPSWKEISNQRILALCNLDWIVLEWWWPLISMNNLPLNRVSYRDIHPITYTDHYLRTLCPGSRDMRPNNK